MLVQQINKIHVLTKECDKLANNIGYLTSSKTPEHQELYTPYYAVEPIVKYIPKVIEYGVRLMLNGLRSIKHLGKWI